MSYALLPARIIWRQNPCSCPIPPSLLGERGPPSPPYIPIRGHAHSYECTRAWVHASVYAAACVAHTYVLVCMFEGEPTLLTCTSIATEHLCLALLFVATVTKAQTGVAAAARARHGGRKEKERGRCLPVDLITTAD